MRIMPKQKKKHKHIHTLIISDLHLGSPVSQPKKVMAMLESHSFRKLILLGDIFDSLDFRNLSKDCWDLLNYIGKISRDKKVRWVIGNHDQGLSDIFGSLMNARTYQSYEWQYNNEKYLAIHGHQFDRFLIDNTFLSYLATAVYNFIQRFDSEEKRFSHFVKRKSKGWLRLSEKVARSALHFGRKSGSNYVFCGHTHKAMKKFKQDIQYYNSGCWTDIPCTYITIDENNIDIRDHSE
jgi:UDP-2,3-diacylglucosamine pyrophosphatase LpxH